MQKREVIVSQQQAQNIFLTCPSIDKGIENEIIPKQIK
jgi:hypothetical protein